MKVERVAPIGYRLSQHENAYVRGALKVAAVKAPGFGDRRKAMLEDMVILRQAELVSEDLGIKLENVTLEMTGTVIRAAIHSQHQCLRCKRSPMECPQGRTRR